MSKGAQIAVGGLLVAGLLAWYGAVQIGAGSYQYFQTLDEFHENAATRIGAPVRVHGYVATGSIERDVEGRQVRFAVQNAPPHAGGDPGPMLYVQYLSLETPDLFKDGAEVVVEGRAARSSSGDVLFVADNVLAKCPSKFEAQLEPAESRSASL